MDIPADEMALNITNLTDPQVQHLTHLPDESWIATSRIPERESRKRTFPPGATPVTNP